MSIKNYSVCAAVITIEIIADESCRCFLCCNFPDPWAKFMHVNRHNAGARITAPGNTATQHF